MLYSKTLAKERSDIMATRSFTDTYKVNKSDVDVLHNIINDKRKIKIKKVVGHKDVKGKAMLDMIALNK